MAFDEAAYQAHIAGLAKGGNFGNATTAGVAGNPSASAKPISSGVQVKTAPAPNFVQKVAAQTFDIGKSLAKAGGSFALHTGQDVLHQAQGAALAIHPELARMKQQNISRNQASLDTKQKQIVSAYKAGKISKDNYNKAMKGLSDGYQELSKENAKLIKETDPQKLAADTAWTAVNVLSGGTGGLVRATGKTAGKEVLDGLLGKGVKTIEDTIAKVPAAKDLMERNASKVVTRDAQKLAGESTEAWLAREGKQIAVGLLIKRPIFYQTNVGLANDTYNHILDGKYDEATKSAGWMAAQMVGGGPVGWFLKNGGKGLSHVGSLARGKGSFIDEVSSRIGNGNRNQLAEYVMNTKGSTGRAAIEDGVPVTKMGQGGSKYVSWHTTDGDMRYSVTFKIDKTGKKTVTRENLDTNGNVTGVENLGSLAKVQEKYGTKDPGEIALRSTTGAVKSYDKKGKPIWSVGGKYHTQTAQEAIDAERTLRILQTTNLKSANGKVDVAADNVLTHYIEHGINPNEITPEQLVKDMSNWAKADEIASTAIKQGVVKGVPPDEVAKYAVVRWDLTAKNGLANAMLTSDGSAAAMADVLNKFSDKAGVGWANNEILMNKLYAIVGKGLTREETAKEIKNISTASTILKGVPIKVQKQLEALGYTIAAPFGGNSIARIDYGDIANSTQKLVTGAIKGNSTVFDVARAPEPILSGISSVLTKAGLSPEAANTVAHQKLSEALVGNLGELGIARNLGLHGEGDMVSGGRALLSELQRYVENKKGAFLVNKISSGKSAVTDIRQLTHDEISTALNISRSEAKDVSRAVRNAYMQVPLELRGLGDKVVDYAIGLPLSPMRYYLRAQSALRYTYNPFFRFQEQAETAILAKMNSSKFVWLTPRAQLDDTVKELEQGGMFSGNIFGAGADDNVIGRLAPTLPSTRSVTWPV
jgi:hypothetical protein